MSIRTPARRHQACAVFAFTCLAATPITLAATDNDPTNNTMAGADALTTIVGQRITNSAELVQNTDQLDVDFFMIDALAGDAVTITLVRIADEGLANNAALNLRLHAYTVNADLMSAPGVGANPTMTFSPTTDGVIYLGVGLACDTNLDGVDDTDPTDREGTINEVETTIGLYDIEITIDRQSSENAILFEDPADCEEEINASCPPTQTFFPDDGSCIIGSLEKRDFPDCRPDTYLVLFDKELNIINQDDNDSTLGNGWASGLLFVNSANGYIDNGDGTYSLRIGITGRPDGLDGDFNGYFLNAPHQQFGEFTLTVSFYDGGSGVFLRTDTYINRFDTGAEAFYINLDVPDFNGHADIAIDNTTGAIAALPDQDAYHLEGLIPFCDYFITQVGGLDWQCAPTDAVMVWVDKNCAIIWDSNEYNADTGYEELTIIADYRGRANFAIAGEDQRSRLLWVGLDLDAQDTIARAPGDCDLPDPNIDHGCYTLCFRLAPPHADATGPMTNDNVVGSDGNNANTAITNAMAKGDINMDGRTDTADLGILLSAFGWIN